MTPPTHAQARAAIDALVGGDSPYRVDIACAVALAYIESQRRESQRMIALIQAYETRLGELAALAATPVDAG